MTTYPAPVHLDDLQVAYNGSYLTVLGCGGDLQEWVDGLNGFLEENGCGHPAQWFVVSGAEVNHFAGLVDWTVPEAFQPDLIILLAPLDDLNVPVLALFRLGIDMKWFDDVVQSMHPSH